MASNLHYLAGVYVLGLKRHSCARLFISFFYFSAAKGPVATTWCRISWRVKRLRKVMAFFMLILRPLLTLNQPFPSSQAAGHSLGETFEEFSKFFLASVHILDNFPMQIYGRAAAYPPDSIVSKTLAGTSFRHSYLQVGGSGGGEVGGKCWYASY